VATQVVNRKRIERYGAPPALGFTVRFFSLAVDDNPGVPDFEYCGPSKLTGTSLLHDNSE
jgi:hypothetical protein